MGSFSTCGGTCGCKFLKNVYFKFLVLFRENKMLFLSFEHRGRDLKVADGMSLIPHRFMAIAWSLMLFPNALW